MQTAAHLVKTLAYLGKLTDLVCLDLNAEMPFADGFYAITQFFQGPDNP